MTLAPAADESAPDPVITRLGAERATVLEIVTAIPAERLAERVEPDRWSAVELLEHLALVELGIAKLIAARTAVPAPSDADQLATARQGDARLALALDRSRRFDAPDRVRPSGTLTAAAAFELLDSARARLVAAYRAAPSDVLDGAAYPHPVFGLLTLCGWAEFASWHDARHAEQLRELAAAMAAPDAT